MSKIKNKYIILLSAFVFSMPLCASQRNNQETEFTFDHVNSFKKYEEIREELETLNFNPPLTVEEEKQVDLSIKVLNEELNRNTEWLKQEEKISFYKKLEENFQKYPIPGNWMIRKEGKIMGRLTLTDQDAHNEEAPGEIAIHTYIIDREQAGGAGTKARKYVYEQITPYIGKEIENIWIETTQASLTPLQKKLPINERLDLRKSLPATQVIKEGTYIFNCVKSWISPYDNFASLISQIRCGSAVSSYGKRSINVSYPALNTSILVEKYPRIEELRNIVSKLDDRNTRNEAIKEYKSFFESL